MLRHVALMAVCSAAIVSLSCDVRQAEAPAVRHQRSKVAGSRASATVDVLARIQRVEWRRSDPDGWLLRQLRGGDAVLRARAALAVGRIGHPRGLEPLVDALSATSASVRASAAFALQLYVLDALGGAAPSAVLRALRRTLSKERNPRARQALLASLGWVGEPSDAGLIGRYLQPAPAASLLGLGLITGREQPQPFRRRTANNKPDPQAARLLPLLQGDDLDLRRLTAWTLSRMAGRRRFASSLGDALRQEVATGSDPMTRIWSIRALSPPRTPRAIRWFSKRLADRDPQVRSEAARGLSRSTRGAAVRLARGLLRSWRAISANQQRLVGPEVRPVLVGLDGLLAHARIPTVRHVAGLLVELSDVSEATIPYKDLEKHSIDLVNCAAARVWDLGKGLPERTPTCGAARSPQLSIVWRRAQVPPALGPMRRDPQWRLTMLRRYLQDAAVEVRVAATKALVHIDDDAIATATSRSLEDPSPAVFSAAARVVARHPGHLASGRVVEALVRRLHSLSPAGDPEAICAGLAALRGLEVIETLPTVRKLMGSAAWTVRSCATVAWEGLTGQHADPVEPPSRGLPNLRWSKTAPLPRRAVLVTPRGEVVLELFPAEAPAAVALLARMIADGDLTSLRAHRFPKTQAVHFGTGSMSDTQRTSPYRIPCELTQRPFARGSVGMSISGRDTARGDFFITRTRRPEHDGRYTQVARVVSGMKAIDRLLPGDAIEQATVGR